MANLIRLKQIESGSALQASADAGSDFSQSVINIITSEVQAVLPNGVVSSSAQIVLSQTTGSLTSSRLDGSITADSIDFDNITGLPTLVSGSTQIILGDTTGQLTSSKLVGDITATSVNYGGIIGLPTLVSGSSQIISILEPLNQHSSSINEFTASLDNTYATDAEVYISQSTINIDMGEW